MKKKYFITAALALTLSAANIFSSMAAGFVISGKTTKYQWGDGSYCTNNWVHYRDHWFFFGADQNMRTGWIQKDNTWYFAADSGELQGGIMKINGNVYYFNTTSCKMVTGPMTYHDEQYYFTENGTSGSAPYVYTEWNSNGSIKRGKKFGVRS